MGLTDRGCSVARVLGTRKLGRVRADRESIPFSFDSSALAEGGKAVLTVKLIDGGKEIASVSQTITRLKKNSGSMVWIENGIIVKNGKPWYPRHIYAMGYRGGKAFTERFKSDDLAASPFRMATLEPGRLVRVFLFIYFLLNWLDYMAFLL